MTEASSGGPDPDARVVVLTRTGCHLCADALGVVAEVCRETGTTFREVDVDSDLDLQRQYTDQVPVTFVDGRQHDFWRVDRQRLRAALAS
jgi:glutaredoxin